MSEEKCYDVGGRGVAVRVRARPGARDDAVVGPRGAELVVDVRAKPERGRANEEVRRVLADALGVRRDEVELKVGATSHHKVFLVPRAALPGLVKLCG